MDVLKAVKFFNLFTVLKKLKECVGFFFFNNLIATNDLQPCDSWLLRRLAALDSQFCKGAVMFWF
jgi:hypothetical protein